MGARSALSGRWVTIVQLTLLAIALALSAYAATQAFKPKPILRPPRFSPGASGGRGLRAQGMRGMPPVDRKIVKDFDKNGDNRLDRAERAAAREWLRTQPAGGFGRFGGRGRVANPEPGMHLRPSDVRSHPNVPFYDPRTLRTAFLIFADDDWADERPFVRSCSRSRLSASGICNTCTTSPRNGSTGKSSSREFANGSR